MQGQGQSRETAWRVPGAGLLCICTLAALLATTPFEPAGIAESVRRIDTSGAAPLLRLATAPRSLARVASRALAAVLAPGAPRIPPLVATADLPAGAAPALRTFVLLAPHSRGPPRSAAV